MNAKQIFLKEIQDANVHSEQRRYYFYYELVHLVNDSAVMNVEQWSQFEKIAFEAKFSFDRYELLAIATYVNSCRP